ncbi:MAG: hypothetical protein PVF05_03235 [Gemmatimonadales bacterium]|jgi:hypothetical protein
MTEGDPAARWDEIDAVLSAALERPVGERLVFVRERTADDPELAAAVEDLLAAGDAATSFLERPIDVDPDELIRVSNEMLARWRSGEEAVRAPSGLLNAARGLVRKLGRIF